MKPGEEGSVMEIPIKVAASIVGLRPSKEPQRYLP